MRRLFLLLAVLTLTVTAAGCGGAVVKESELETQAKKAVGSVAGREPESIDCPGDIDAEVDATIRCVLEDNGRRWGMTITITEVDGEDVRFTTQVDDEQLTDEAG